MALMKSAIRLRTYINNRNINKKIFFSFGIINRIGAQRPWNKI